MTIRKIERLYYGYYLWAAKKEWDKVPEFTALLSLAGVILLNVFTIVLMVHIVTGVVITQLMHPNMYVVFMLGYLAVFVMMFYGNKRYKRVISKMNGGTELEIRKSKRAALVYAICTIAIFLSVVIFDIMYR